MIDWYRCQSCLWNEIERENERVSRFSTVYIKRCVKLKLHLSNYSNMKNLFPVGWMMNRETKWFFDQLSSVARFVFLCLFSLFGSFIFYQFSCGFSFERYNHMIWSKKHKIRLKQANNSITIKWEFIYCSNAIYECDRPFHFVFVA